MPEVSQCFFIFSSWMDNFRKGACLSSILLNVSKNVSRESFVLSRFSFKIQLQLVDFRSVSKTFLSVFL